MELKDYTRSQKICSLSEKRCSGKWPKKKANNKHRKPKKLKRALKITQVTLKQMRTKTKKPKNKRRQKRRRCV